MRKILSFSADNNLHHIKRIVQDAIVEDFRRKYEGK